MSEKQGGEIQPQEIMAAFKREYLDAKEPFRLIFVDISDNMANDETHISVDFAYRGEEIHSEADGNGPD